MRVWCVFAVFLTLCFANFVAADVVVTERDLSAVAPPGYELPRQASTPLPFGPCPLFIPAGAIENEGAGPSPSPND